MGATNELHWPCGSEGNRDADTPTLGHLAAERPGSALIASTYRRLQRFDARLHWRRRGKVLSGWLGAGSDAAPARPPAETVAARDAYVAACPDWAEAVVRALDGCAG